MIAYCMQADLEIALGGADVLLQLADPNGLGVLDISIVEDYLESGAAEVRSAVEIKHDPETIANLDSDATRRLRDANASLSARIAYEKGSKGMAMPDRVRERADRTDRWLDLLAEGKRRLGRVAGGATAAINQPAQTVNFDPHNHKTSISSFKKGGFR